MLYISTTARPHISGVVNILSRRNENPKERDWHAVKPVIKYLKTTQKLKLIISNKNKPVLTKHADSVWAGEKSDWKSSTGKLCKLGNTNISCSTKKQTSVILPSSETEYISAATAAEEIVWIINHLKNFDLQ